VLASGSLGGNRASMILILSSCMVSTGASLHNRVYPDRRLSTSRAAITFFSDTEGGLEFLVEGLQLSIIRASAWSSAIRPQ